MPIFTACRSRRSDRYGTAAAIVVAVASSIARADTHFVPQDFPTIQAAVNFASDGDTVIVQSGTYFENIDLLGKSISLNGVGVNSPTIIGSPGSPIINVGASSHPPLISNLTLRDGDGLLGGGISIGSNATTIIRNVRLWHNSASAGGAVFLYAGADVIVDGCDFWSNEADVEGGAIAMLSGSSLDLRDTVLESNSAGHTGGAVRAFDADITISGTTHFLNNDAIFDGGAIEAVSGATIGLANTRFTGNDSGWSGGAIALFGSSAFSEGIVCDSNDAFVSGGAVSLQGQSTYSSYFDTFSNNSSINGGALDVFESHFYSNVSTLRGNTASSYGGGIYAVGTFAEATAWMYNAIIDENTARWGGGVVAYVGDASSGPTSAIFANCQITNNMSSVPDGQGGFFAGQNGSPHAQSEVRLINSLVTRNGGGNENGVHVQAHTPFSIENSIVWGNSGPGLSGGVSGPVAARSIFPEADSYPGAGNINADPELRDPAAGDFSLLMTSPAIDAGDSTLLPEDFVDDDGDGDLAERMPLDLAGFQRFIDDPLTADVGISGGSGTVDIGPNEYQRTCLADFAEPLGVTNFFDVSAFIAAFNAEHPSADLAAPFGTFNFFDVSTFLSAYNAGCP